MSYEGHEIWLCCNGHRRVFGCYDAPNMQEWRCSCGEPLCYWYGVDETNGEAVEVVPEVYREAETEQCPCCGHVKETKERQYCIPSDCILWLNRTPTVPSASPKYRNNRGQVFDTKREACESYHLTSTR